jgi:hypothetical protein
MTIQSITIIGRRWQDRSGNTYFSATALVDGREEARIDLEYGYGDQYVDASLKALKEKGLLKGEASLFRECQTRGIRLHYEAADVGRKSDL